jgi:hypothetical protein
VSYRVEMVVVGGSSTEADGLEEDVLSIQELILSFLQKPAFQKPWEIVRSPDGICERYID